MIRGLREHWPEYLCEAAELGLFMISAGLFTILLHHPGSAVVSFIPGEFTRRMLTGIAMGSTAIALVFSPLGKRSGAHFNPAVTLAFWRLGKVKNWDAVFYIVAQFIGAIAGVFAVTLFAREPLSHSAVNYAATLPGMQGVIVAFIAEFVIAFVLMSVVLRVGNTPHLARYTGLFAGALVATYITFESPLSGMSMNPARTFGSAFVGHIWVGLWIYFTAPLLAMQLAAVLYTRGKRTVYCAKYHHYNSQRCIFNCRFPELLKHEAVAGGVDAGRAMRGTTQPGSSAFAKATADKSPPSYNKYERAMTERFSLFLFVIAFSCIAAQAAVSVESVGMTVSDMDRAMEFYSALKFQEISDVEVLGDKFEHLEGVFGARMRTVRMQLGNEFLDLTQYLTPPGRPIPADSRSNDLWFQHIAIVVRDMDEAFEKLRALKVQFVSTGPQTLPPSIKAAAGIKAFYFRDPDGHNLEIIYFPPGKGDPRWQEKTDRLFLGIDHTAIGISNTDASVKFYRGLLGLHKAGESENFGTEQEHLNQVFGAHLHITGMRADAGPGIEFLEYLMPRDGRPQPADIRANDIVHWQTMIATDELDLLAKKLRDARVPFVSSGVVAMPKDKAGFSKGALISDPDGHRVLLIQK